MDTAGFILDIKKNLPVVAGLDIKEVYGDEIHMEASPQDFRDVCVRLHKMLRSPVMMLFGADERAKSQAYGIRCVFLSARHRKWVIVTQRVPQENPTFDSLSRSVYSASSFEREIHEMLGVKPEGHPDARRLALHDEVWPVGWHPLRKDFVATGVGAKGAYFFSRVEGEGIFEVPVGPVHAGIIGPGHFRFSVAGEPIVNLELRLGFTHRGVEKFFEGKTAHEAVGLAEVVCGDASFAHSLAFTRAMEKINHIEVPRQAEILRAVFLELERLYNHVHVIGGIAVDVAFTLPAASAAVIKENLLQLNEFLSGSRYLRKINVVGGVTVAVNSEKKARFLETLDRVERDFQYLKEVLEGSVSFMDRVDTTGVLRRKTAEDIGILGLAGRASGIGLDLRAIFGGVYDEVKFRMAIGQSGDVLARLKVRFAEFSESVRLIRAFANKLESDKEIRVTAFATEGSAQSAIGFAEGARGPVLYWVRTDAAGIVDRCNIVDPSFHNWQGLSFAVLGNIIPDFPVCNKSFDLSYAGNDL